MSEMGKERSDRRFWWWRMESADHEPLPAHLFGEGYQDIMDAWYKDTNEKEYIGECAPPMVSFLLGFIGGNAIKRIVELGHYAGYSTLHYGYALKGITNGRLATIDISSRMSEYTALWIRRAELCDHVKVINEDSVSPEAVRASIEFIGGEPEVVIIDSSHKFDGTLKELDVWMPVLKMNGFIFLHDASNAARSYDPERGAVAGAIETWCSRHNQPYFVLNGGDVTPAKSHNVLVYRDGRGLGIIQKIRELV